jgi:hypothetical protein
VRRDVEQANKKGGGLLRCKGRKGRCEVMTNLRSIMQDFPIQSMPCHGKKWLKTKKSRIPGAHHTHRTRLNTCSAIAPCTRRGRFASLTRLIELMWPV